MIASNGMTLFRRIVQEHRRVIIPLVGLLVVDVLARSRWGWDRFRVGLILGLFAVAGFWIVRLAMSWQSAAAVA